MKSHLSAIAVLACAACNTGPAPPPGTQEADAPRTSGDSLVNRVWSRVDAGAAPGSLRIFLDDGVLLQDSCWETYRLSQWRLESPTRVVWSEDGIEITADIVHLTDDALTLRIALRSEEVVEAYALASSPYLCPDLPR